MTHLSLFSGIGGLDIAAEMAGFETVGQCEAADYPTKILEQHWPEVPRWQDIRALTKGGFYERTGLQTVDLISGGFPCQPFSAAGKQLGRSDPRYLWPEMFRIITELAPRWIVAENVPGILRIAAADVIADLESAGYHVVVFVYEAAAVGALHQRSRITFVAKYDSKKSRPWRAEPAGKPWQAGAANSGTALGDTEHDGLSATTTARSAAPAGNGDAPCETALFAGGLASTITRSSASTDFLVLTKKADARGQSLLAPAGYSFSMHNAVQSISHVAC